MPEKPEKSPKNIVICCDGTGNEFGECNSNVVKLYTAMIVNNAQVAYYHPGVGTMGAPNRRTRLGKKWSVLEGLVFGAGFMDNVEDAYRFLMEQYDDGDRIYLFGFSRGAYTVRALAGILHAYGLLCRGNEGHIPYVLRMFMDDVGKTREKQGKKTLPIQYAFKETFSHDVTVEFAGLWDTVSSIGWIYSPVRLLYSAQNPIVQTGRHAVSIDERRCFYHDNLWGPQMASSETPTLKCPQDILQVWFAGVHSDVGGSYKQSESALANRALQWLLDEAEKVGLQVDRDRVRMIFGQPTEQKHAAAELYAQPDEPGIVHRSLRGPWWLLEFLPHRYYDNDDEKEKWRIPLGHTRQVPDGSFLHPSVIERLKDSRCEYRPKNIRIDKIVPPVDGPKTPVLSGTAAGRTGFYMYESGKGRGGKMAKKLAMAATVAGSVGILAAVIAGKARR